MPLSLTFGVRATATIVTGFLLAASVPAADKLQYNRDVRPILAENCFACHGADSAARKAKLRLDDREVAVEKGAIVAGNIDESELVNRLFLKDDDELRMPPPGSHKKLTPAQKETLKRWVAEGAVYEAHWSFITPKKPAPPSVKDMAWVKSPIDAFVLAELEKKGLKPAPEADRRTLARRAALDVTGLPPKVEDVEAFVADKSPNAYEKYLDKMLASPHYGEHRGRYWLDAARYGDSHGIHFDNFREMWSYREWVIRALNENKPFDQFTIEQLAGDLLPNPTMDQLVATGFNRCNITTNEGGAINEEYLVLYTRDRTDVTSTVWMGLTAGCAVCHDHKYDPISQREFYSLAAFFNNTTQIAMDGNIQNTPPIITVPKLGDRSKWEALVKKVAAAQAELDARKKTARAGFETWIKETKPESLAKSIPKRGLTLHAEFNEGKGDTFNYAEENEPREAKLPAGVEWKAGPNGGKAATFKPVADGPTISFPDAGDFDADQAFSFGTYVQIPQRGQNGGVIARMDTAQDHRGWDLYLENDRFAVHVVHNWPSDAFKVTTKAGIDPNKWHHVFVTYDGSRKADGVRIYLDGEPQPLDVATNTTADPAKLKTPFGSIKTNAPLTIGRRTPGQPVKLISIEDLRVYDRALTGTEVSQLANTAKAIAVLNKPADKRVAKETDELFSWWLTTTDADYQKMNTALQVLKQDETEIKTRGTIAHIMVEKTTPPEAYILNRGEYDQRREKVTPVTPKALPTMSDDLPKNRLGFAKWLLRPEHPLTARVTVNRYWQEIFGQGLVRTAGDFGISGEQPSHPELLDWLAVTYREEGWDTKRFFKQLLLTNTYRQASTVTQEKIEKDPQNKFYSRGARFRMDAEIIRDYALAASGILVPKIGGPSVKPYQPIGVWEAVAMPGSNTRDYRPETGENLYRRSMYTFWKRAAPPASMEIFNAPNRETCTVRRDRTNTPLQALVTLNDVQFVEAARYLAQTTILTHTTAQERMDFLAKRLLARPFRAEETAVVLKSQAALLKHYQAKPDDAKKLIAVGESKPDPRLDPAELAAWTMLINELLNLDEVLCK